MYKNLITVLMNKNYNKFLYLFKNYLNFIRNSTISFCRKDKNFTKNKNVKIRLFCKNIVLITLMLSIILLVELHTIYYKTSINTFTIKTFFFIVLFFYFLFFSFFYRGFYCKFFSYIKKLVTKF